MKQEKKYVSDVPELLKEWDYEKNEGLYSPDKITIGNSRTRVNWICSTCGFRWPASVYNRHHLGRGCRQCGNKRISEKLHNLKLKKGVNDLASQHPDLLLEWDYEKNSTICAPDEITIGNGSQKVHWICSTCGYRWPATVYSRVHLNSGCPPCGDLEIGKKSRERRFDPNKNLLTLFPDIAAEWNPTKNTSLELEKIMPGSNNDVWWLCSTCGTEYHTQVVNRTGYKHVGCRTCNKHMHTSFPEQAIFYYVKSVFPNAENKYTDVFDNRMELDIYIPELATAIEYDGSYWHSKTSIDQAKRKYAVCQKHNIRLIRVKENYKRYEICLGDCDNDIFRMSPSDDGLKEVILAVFDLLSTDVILDVDISRDGAEIKSSYIVSFKEKSLLAKYPELCTEWHPTLNGKLRPDMVMPSCHDKVWWLCFKCGQPYPASPGHRTRPNPTGCSVCAGKRIVAGINDLASKRPDLAIDWHPTLNGDLLPTQVALNYSKKVWWKCHVCGHEYFRTPNERVNKNQGCRECSKSKHC